MMQTFKLLLKDRDGFCHYVYDHLSIWETTQFKSSGQIFLDGKWVPVEEEDSETISVRMEKLAIFKIVLREERRLKHGCDYAVIQKYGKTRIATDPVYQETIQEFAVRFGIEVVEWLLFQVP